MSKIKVISQHPTMLRSHSKIRRKDPKEYHDGEGRVINFILHLPVFRTSSGKTEVSFPRVENPMIVTGNKFGSGGTTTILQMPVT